MTDPYEPPRPRDDALQEELDSLHEQERQGHSTPKEQRERRLRVDEHGAEVRARREGDREAGGEMAQDASDRPADQFHRDRHEHGGIGKHIDDDQLARLTEEERVAAGIDDYDPDEVPPATDEPQPWDVTQTEVYQEEGAEIRRELDQDELQIEGRRDRMPPTRYDR